MKRKLIFIGGGDFCRELLWTSNCIDPSKRDWEPFGVLDDNPEKAVQHLTARGFPLPVLGRVSDHQPRPDEVFIPAIGNSAHKLRTCDMIAAEGGQFISLVHPTATIAPGVQLGKGVFCFVNTVISIGAVLDDYVALNVAAVVGHDCTVGAGCTLSPGSILCGNVQLGRGVFLGTGATVTPGVSMGDFSLLGAGSVAFSGVSPGLTVLGVPARPVVPSGKANKGV